MNRKKAAVIFITLFSIICLLPLKTEAALHPYFNAQDFYDSYNFWIENGNQRSSDFQTPLLESLTAINESDREFVGYFDDTFPNAKIFIGLNKYGKIASIHVIKEIDGFTQLHGKTFPTDISAFNNVAAYILMVLEYPTNTNSYRQKLGDVIAEMAYNYDNKKQYTLYNPVTEVSYLLYYKYYKGELSLSITQYTGK